VAGRRNECIQGPFRTLFEAGAVGGLTDGQLLDRFVERRGAAEAAFAALIERHGPMVLRVCRDVLRDPHDAQDAFQATFLVLVRKAGSIRSRDSVGSWLFGVACRVANSARVAAARRRSRELQASACKAEAVDEGERPEIGPLLREEIDRLPEPQRAAIVLCYLEGLSHDQAAQRLGWPVGTVRSRLARARERLRGRLARRGMAPTVVPLGLEASLKAARDAVPYRLVDSTVQCALGGASDGGGSKWAAALADQVARAMLMGKLTKAAIVVALGCLGASLAMPGDRHIPRGPFGLAARADEVGPRAEPDTLEVAGRTAYDPDTLIKVRSRFDASVERVYAVLGQKVSKGDKLADLHSNDLAATKSDYRSKYVQWKHDNNLLNVRRDLVKTGAISKQEFIDTQDKEKKSKLDYILAEDKLRVFKVPEDEIKALIKGLENRPDKVQPPGRVDGKMTLLSPADGFVIERGAIAGNHYKTSDTLMVIAPLDHLWVWADVPEKYLDPVKVGRGCEVKVPGIDTTFRGKVEAVFRVDPVDHRVRIRTTIPNPGGRLKSDSWVRVVLIGD
jgi:RNA polymerase sigma factor (sigma-70 family)